LMNWIETEPLLILPVGIFLTRSISKYKGCRSIFLSNAGDMDKGYGLLRMVFFIFLLMSRYPPVTNGKPIMNIRLLFLSMPYATANMPIIHIRMIGVFSARIYALPLEAIKYLSHLKCRNSSPLFNTNGADAFRPTEIGEAI
jgi:hypothetical protein